MRSITFRVTGRVQGVGFRAFTAREAQRLGVRGWVRNALDGAVVGEAEGEESTVESFVQALHRGPRASRVNAVDVEPAAPAGATGFAIRR